MKKWITGLLVCCLLVLSACSAPGSAQEQTEPSTTRETAESTEATQPSTIRLPMHNMEPGSGCAVPDTWD